MNMKNNGDSTNELMVKQKIKDYFSRFSVELADDQDIFEVGLVHSLFAIQLILFIEKEFGIELDDDEIDFDSVRTVNDIKELVFKKISVG